MIYKAGSRFRIHKSWEAQWHPLTSRNGVIVRELPNDLRRVLRDGLRTVETWHIHWFTREHK